MLIPNKYENLQNNMLVTASVIIKLLKKRNYSIEELYQISSRKFNLNPDRFFDIITFLWLAGIIEKKKYFIMLRKNDTE